MIAINGEVYDVEVASLSRQIQFVEKYREMTEDGAYHREIQGVYHQYTLELGNIDPAEYDRLVAALSSYAEYQTVTLPSARNSTVTFRAMLENITDGVIAQDEDGYYWDNLSISFTAKEPEE